LTVVLDVLSLMKRHRDVVHGERGRGIPCSFPGWNNLEVGSSPCDLCAASRCLCFSTQHFTDSAL
jgi:hypothetical protein